MKATVIANIQHKRKIEQDGVRCADVGITVSYGN